MSNSAYLDMLDELLRAGLDGVSRALVDSQVSFVVDCQQSDGGFRGRQGNSDFYYTDFAVRTLAALSPERAALDRAARYIANPPQPPRGVIDCFSVLNVRRMLANRLPVDAAAGAFDPAALTAQLQAHVSVNGGLARSAGGVQTSAYHTFLGALCFQLLGSELPEMGRAIAAVRALECPDGGFVESTGQTIPQTSVTAAAAAFLMLHNALPDDTLKTARFLAEMQCADGGLKPHAAVPQGDLLSTFTGLTVIGSLGALHLVDLAGVARFLRNCACASGGFAPIAGSDAADVEYTFYGLGTLALLRTSGLESNAVAQP
jgi:geranylgeranyl transferase type-2 subunit beta